MAWRAARHQSGGCCSAQPICGEDIGWGSGGVEPTTRPEGSSNTARVPPVPMSIPSNLVVMLDLRLCVASDEERVWRPCPRLMLPVDSRLRNDSFSRVSQYGARDAFVKNLGA